MVIGLLILLIDVIVIKIYDQKIRENFKLKFIVTWSTIVALLLWVGGIIYVILKM